MSSCSALIKAFKLKFLAEVRERLKKAMPGHSDGLKFHMQQACQLGKSVVQETALPVSNLTFRVQA